MPSSLMALVKVYSILVVPKNLPPLYATAHYMMQNPRGA
jgi:hypothetical protein